MKPSGFYLGDCMDAMREFPDKFFDLAIVDPPYGLDRMSKGTARTDCNQSPCATMCQNGDPALDDDGHFAGWLKRRASDE